METRRRHPAIFIARRINFIYFSLSTGLSYVQLLPAYHFTKALKYCGKAHNTFTVGSRIERVHWSPNGIFPILSINKVPSLCQHPAYDISLLCKKHTEFQSLVLDLLLLQVEIPICSTVGSTWVECNKFEWIKHLLMKAKNCLKLSQSTCSTRTAGESPTVSETSLTCSVFVWKLKITDDS